MNREPKQNKTSMMENATSFVFAEPGLLGHVLSLAGRKEHIFFGSVARSWRDSLRLDYLQRSMTPKTCIEAAVVSQSRLVWAMECGGLSWSKQVAKVAAKTAGGIPALQYAIKAGRLSPGGDWVSGATELCQQAAEAGNLENLQFLRSTAGFPWDVRAPMAAARRGDLPLLQWCVANGCPCDAFTTSLAASAGHFELLQWAWEHAPNSRDTNLCRTAAAAGHLEILQWARTIGCEWGRTVAAAAEAGHVVILAWAMSNGCPFVGTEVCALAAYQGNLGALKFLRSNGCPWNADTCLFARMRHQRAVLDWIHANGCPCWHGNHG
ncbi:unnamed protein product [Phaeothamnion confervicola]